MKRKLLVMLSLIVASSVTAGALVLTIGLPAPSPCASIRGTERTFTIIANLQGLNNSKNTPSPWPVMNVGICDQVTVHYMNEDNQSHGLAVDYYFTKGLTPLGGETQTLSLTASKAGQFRVFCTIFCTVHIYMQDGLLNVS